MNLATLKMILPTELYEQAIRKYNRLLERGTNIHPAPSGVANVEQTVGNGCDRTKAGARFHSPVDIIVHSYRKKLADTDGVSAKAAIDGLVHCGVLPDDTTAQIQSITYRQSKIEKGEEEYTLIHIFPVKEVAIS